MLRGMVGILDDRIMQRPVFLRALGRIHRLSFGFQAREKRIGLGIFERVFFSDSRTQTHPKTVVGKIDRTHQTSLRTGASLPASWHIMMALGKCAGLIGGLWSPQAVPAFCTGFASQHGGLSASRPRDSPLQTQRAQLSPALFSGPDTPSYQLSLVQGNKTHVPQPVRSNSGLPLAQDMCHLSRRSGSQSVLSHRDIHSPKGCKEEGGSSMKQGTFFFAHICPSAVASEC